MSSVSSPSRLLSASTSPTVAAPLHRSEVTPKEWPICLNWLGRLGRFWSIQKHAGCRRVYVRKSGSPATFFWEVPFRAKRWQKVQLVFPWTRHELEMWSPGEPNRVGLRSCQASARLFLFFVRSGRSLQLDRLVMTPELRCTTEPKFGA